MFGCHNYGDIPGLLNRADGDPWDVFALGYGYKELQIGKPYEIRNILGYLRLENGNDKIAVRLYWRGFELASAREEVRRFTQKYTRRVKPGYWVSMNPDFDDL